MEMEKKVIGGHGPAAKDGEVNEGEDADVDAEKKQAAL